MSLGNSIMTAGFSALFGVAVLVIGQLIQRLFIEPIQEQRKAIGEVDFYIDLLDGMKNTDAATARMAGTGGELAYGMQPSEAFHALRNLSAKLQSSLRIIPFYGYLEGMRIVIRRQQIATIVNELKGWANNLSGGDPEPARMAIRNALSGRR
jgi:hypothetical protein